MNDGGSWLDQLEGQARPGSTGIRLLDATERMKERAEAAETLAEKRKYDPVYLEHKILMKGHMEQAVLDDLRQLTGGNRRQTDRLMGRARAYLLFDMNFLKKINDELGHREGDRLLMAFVESLKEVVREADLYGKVGGDEFGIWMSGTDEEQLRTALLVERKNGERHLGAADAIRKRASEIFGRKVEFGMGASFRTIQAGDDPQLTWDEMFREAETLMYADKQKRKSATGGD